MTFSQLCFRILCPLGLTLWLIGGLTSQMYGQAHFLEFQRKDRPSVLHLIGEGQVVLCRYTQNGKKARAKGILRITVTPDSLIYVGAHPMRLAEMQHITLVSDWWNRKTSAALMVLGGLGLAAVGTSEVTSNTPNGVPNQNETVKLLAFAFGVPLIAAGTMQFALPGKYFYYNKRWHFRVKAVEVYRPPGQ